MRSGTARLKTPSGEARSTGGVRHVINGSGPKIYLEDIDLLLERHQAVREACTFPIPDEKRAKLSGSR